MEYRILSAGNTEQLALQVETHLAGGWTLQGGVCVTKEDDLAYRAFYQAVTRDHAAITHAKVRSIPIHRFSTAPMLGLALEYQPSAN